MLKVSTSTTVLSKVVVLYVPVVVTKVKVRTRTCEMCAQHVTLSAGTKIKVFMKVYYVVYALQGTL